MSTKKIPNVVVHQHAGPKIENHFAVIAEALGGGRTRVCSLQEYATKFPGAAGGCHYDRVRELFHDGASWLVVDEVGRVVAGPGWEILREPYPDGDREFRIGVDFGFTERKAAMGEMSEYHHDYPNPEPEGVWRMRDGEVIPTRAMETSHLRNALMVCWRIADAWRWSLVLSMSCHELNGEHAVEAIDAEMSALGALTPTELLKRSPQWERAAVLVAEWERRCKAHSLIGTRVVDGWFDARKVEPAQRGRFSVTLDGRALRVDSVESTSTGLVLRRAPIGRPLYAECLEGTELVVSVQDVAAASITTYVYEVSAPADMPLRLGFKTATGTEAVAFASPVLKSRRVTTMEAAAK